MIFHCFNNSDTDLYYIQCYFSLIYILLFYVFLLFVFIKFIFCLISSNFMCFFFKSLLFSSTEGVPFVSPGHYR